MPIEEADMNCRKGCGACCIAISISGPLPLHPGGKKAGLRCAHLLTDNTCSIYNDRPRVCREFRADPEFCGKTCDEALFLLKELEEKTL